MLMKLMESKALLFSFQVLVLSMGPRPGPKLVFENSQRARSAVAKAKPQRMRSQLPTHLHFGQLIPMQTGPRISSVVARRHHD